MRITREEAHAWASAKKKLLTVKKGQAWLFAAYVPGAAYHAVHWDHIAQCSVQCDGPTCTYCPRPVNRKLHVPAFVCKRPYRAEEVAGLKFPADILYRADHWGEKIVELTANCFAAFDVPSAPDQLGIAWRPGSKQNGTLFFKWLPIKLLQVPPELAALTVEKILPGVIGGRYVDAREVTPALDIPEGSRIKHNESYRRDADGNSDDGDGAAAAAAAPEPSPRIGPRRGRGKAGAA